MRPHIVVTKENITLIPLLRTLLKLKCIDLGYPISEFEITASLLTFDDAYSIHL